jgi:hypothetical protein
MEKNMATTAKDVADAAMNMSRDVKDSVVEFSKSAGRKIDTAREQTGDALREAAATVRQGSARIDVLAGSAASHLDAAATAVKDANLKSVSTGLRRFGQNNLLATVLAAVAVGYLVGSALNRPSANE